jgi:hypothetical protein
MESSSELRDRPAENTPAVSGGKPANPQTRAPNSLQDQTSSEARMSPGMRALASALWNADHVDRASESEWTHNLQRTERVMAQLRHHGAEIFTPEALRTIFESAFATRGAAVVLPVPETGDPIHRHPLSWRVPASPGDAQ